MRKGTLRPVFPLVLGLLLIQFGALVAEEHNPNLQPAIPTSNGDHIAN